MYVWHCFWKLRGKFSQGIDTDGLQVVWNKENFIEGFKPNYRLETGTKSPRTVSAKGYSNIYMEPEADLSWAGLSRLLQRRMCYSTLKS